MIGFVTGLASEAACLAPLVDRTRLRVAGIGEGNAERCARDLIASGCTLLVSFGLAGGLARDRKPGDIVVADSVVTPEGYAYPADAASSARLLAALPNAVRRPIAGSNAIVATRAEKEMLHWRTRAAAVDMESHQVAQAAHAGGIGFAAIRAIADPYSSGLPSAALGAVGADGTPSVARVALGLARRPWEIGGLIRLGLYSRAAHASLRRVAPVVVGCEGRL